MPSSRLIVFRGEVDGNFGARRRVGAETSAGTQYWRGRVMLAYDNDNHVSIAENGVLVPAPPFGQSVQVC